MHDPILIPTRMRYPLWNIMTHPHRPGLVRAALLIGLATAACKKDGGNPAYVQMGAPVVLSAGGDTISSKITDLWVYVNDQPAGVWEPGRRVPLLSSGPSNVKLIAGVRKNGVTDDRIQYPFYATFSKDLDLVPEKIQYFTPDFRYFEGVDFWLQDFEGGFQFDTLQSDVQITPVPADGSLVGQGGYSGSVTLDEAHDVFKCVSGGDPFLVPDGANAFLEMDYRSDTEVLVGVRYSVNEVPYETGHVYLRATGSSENDWRWNKVYIDLATPWAVNGAVEKRFFLRATLAPGASNSHVQLDNVELVRP